MKVYKCYWLGVLAVYLGFGVPLAVARDPFRSLLPAEKKERVTVSEINNPHQEETVSLKIDLQGVFWGVERPQAIINGKVYNVGDKLPDYDGAEIVKIEKDSVSISYKDKVFIFRPRSEINLK